MLCRMMTFSLCLAMLPLAKCQFTSPPAAAVLVTGDKVDVEYTTDLKKYTIALWQRPDDGGRPKLGSIVYATTEGPSSGFTWTVKAHNLDLGASHTFFLWLFEGNASQQGTSLHQISSSYFNITDKRATPPPSSTSAAAVEEGEEEEEGESTPSPSPLPSPSQSSGPAGPDGTLSVGARAGIGAAASVFCLLVVTLLVALCRRARRARRRRGPDDDAGAGAGTGTDYANSIAELQSECVSPRPVLKVPPVYRPVPGDDERRPSVAELPG
ncbi:uncharacterized protein MAM_05517 [Metarhizium album ARSEF 1941]|uniref:Uncharacterized protein n=1 Tax=Metarhizium album (strain ARSEF 1941) TaxID=1081103 RepID=A0A0B2WSH3_METAS|nr:uncharacterized protein MAM_05517 [Metarhizium album ARSEF 1941]KHN96574.1 hypothetical protein MAM_05517 [Metarhizium album ARSEF 1941]